MLTFGEVRSVVHIISKNSYDTATKCTGVVKGKIVCD